MQLFHAHKERAVVFVDFEYMQISFRKKFGLNPPVLEWYRTLRETYNIDDAFFFADFTNPYMKFNIPEIRKITNNIIDTQQTAAHHKKDYTDFFILDAIYRTAFDKGSPKTIILFTGDGHFSAAARFLIGRCRKHVIVYGIENTISAQLKSNVTACLEYPDYKQLLRLYYPAIIKQIQILNNNTAELPTAAAVIKAVIDPSGGIINQTAIFDAIEEMKTRGYIIEQDRWVSNRKRTRVLTCAVEKCKLDGLL